MTKQVVVLNYPERKKTLEIYSVSSAQKFDQEKQPSNRMSSPEGIRLSKSVANTREERKKKL